jgi:pentatricopeptide repeat protein
MSSNIFVTAYDSTAKNFAEIFCVMIRKVLIVQLLLQNEPERAVRILAKMKRMNVKPNRRTFLRFCFLFLATSTFLTKKEMCSRMLTFLKG